MRKNKVKVRSIQLLICIILSLSTIVFAENNTDDYNTIFKLDEEQSSIKEGVVDILIDSTIKLVFTKNISNGEEMIEINKSCITMVDENKIPIDIEISIKDSNNPENTEDANNIYLKPLNPLEKGKKYTLIISEDLQTNEEYLEKQLPISLNFTTELEEEPPIQEENIIDKKTLIQKLKEALKLKYNIKLEEIEKNKILIIITNKDETIENKYIYIGTMEEVKEIIKKLEAEINKPVEPEDLENPGNKPNPKPDPSPKPDEELGGYPDSDYEDQDPDSDHKDEGYEDEKIDKDVQEEHKNEKPKDDNEYEFNNNFGVALILCVFIGISMYMIYFS
ncbi:Ig-like domain-containing protein [Romboutsia sp.]|uniref:Ig-like domain-containing protein n=1 Tax=Romboutsia sp. TaxID=1965302 RepID=UPI003F2C5A86